MKDTIAEDSSDNFHENKRGSRMETITESGFYNNFQRKYQQCINDPKLKELIKCIRSRPLLLLGLKLGFVLFFGPILLFTAFVVVNIVIGISSFIIFQVIFLIMAVAVIGGVLFFSIASVLLMALSFILLYYLFSSSKKSH